jgi:hypothetical protein
MLLGFNVLDQPGRQGCGDGAQQRDPANHQSDGHHASDASDRLAVAVTDGSHGRDGPPDRVAEIADVGIRVRPLDIKYGQGRAERQQGGATGEIDSDSASEP